MAMAKVTMRDVAKYAGVSVATVSNVLNHNDHKTTEATRNKVFSAVKKLNYRMDMTARTLSKGKSNLIGIFMPQVYENNIPGTILKENPYYSEIISGIEYSARMLGYDILIACIGSAEQAIELTHKRMLDGVAILGGYEEDFWDKVYTLEVPIVTIDSYDHERKDVINVGIDDEFGAYLATKHLLSLGHTNIAIGTAILDYSPVNQQRYKGFVSALTQEGIDIKNCPVIEEEVSIKGGINIGYRLIKDHKDVTAIFIVADIMAYGVIKTLHQFGKNVPDDISIIGFDDLSFSNYTIPALTTVRQDIYTKGVETSKLLIGCIEGNVEIPNSLVLPVSVVIRETTKQRKK